MIELIRRLSIPAIASLVVGITACAAPSRPGPPLLGTSSSPVVAIDMNDVIHFGTVRRSGRAIGLAGVSLWDDPNFATITPQTHTTAVRGGPLVVPVTRGSYIVNELESGYSLDHGVLRGASASGAAASRIVCRSVRSGDSVQLNGSVIAAAAGPAGPGKFHVGPTDRDTAMSLAAAVNDSASPGIAGHFQAETAADPAASVVIEALAPGTSGNGYALSSSDGGRLRVSSLVRGVDGATPAAESWSVLKWVQLRSPLGRGAPVRFRFTQEAQTSAAPLPGANAFLTVHFGDETLNHTESLLLSPGTFTSQAYSPTAACSRVLVGISVNGYEGQWDLSHWELFLDKPKTYRREGEFSLDLDLASAAGPPDAWTPDALAARVKRVGFLIGNENKPEELDRLQSGDVIVTEMGDPYHYPGQQPLDIITTAVGSGLQVFGYVALGRDANESHLLPYPQDALNRAFLRAQSLHLTGVFLDISSNSPPHEQNGFGVSRWRQIWAVKRLHSLGLAALFNDSGSTVLSDVVDLRPTDVDKVRSTDPGVHHPVCDGSPIPWRPEDGIVAESWGLSDAGRGTAQAWEAFVTQGQRLAAGKAAHNIKIYPLFYRFAVDDVQKHSQEAYSYYATAMFGFDGYCLFDDPSRTNDTERPPAPLGNHYLDAAPALSPSTRRLIRSTDIGTLIVEDNPERSLTDPLRRTGMIFRSEVTVSVAALRAQESLGGGTVSWQYQTSADDRSFGPATPLKDTGGVLTGFPDPTPRFCRLSCVLKPAGSGHSPQVTLPTGVAVLYH